MKKAFILMIGLAFLSSSCAIHAGLTTNANLHTTEVELSGNNFKVVASVQGESQAMYIFGIGGISKKALVAEARSEMLSNANLIGSSKAVINETVEVKHSFFPFVRIFEVIVSAHVIEFTDKG
ncbi:DUF6567 family protein [Phaeodactylibacter sp.]|uniref:DUF6567 family protein n=1 Tax=Phaeodactylibacter sp. TaxID=1940289 RepID=UPI0025E284AE|nr:DUF6567 family protein [Phaeodactylibacter sp.]MCI4650811.1 hypothetical protein [Phaeodactylibacter sp.]MCI5089768.1 hypothetical protein [Phaeodactylibacter sp.]